MTASYIVRYHGSAAEPDRFVDYYRNSHAPILQRFPGIGSLVLHHGADFTFDDIPSLNAALASPARAEARDDFGGFPAFDGEVTHQAFVSEKLF